MFIRLATGLQNVFCAREKFKNKTRLREWKPFWIFCKNKTSSYFQREIERWKLSKCHKYSSLIKALLLSSSSLKSVFSLDVYKVNIGTSSSVNKLDLSAVNWVWRILPTMCCLFNSLFVWSSILLELR